MQNGQAPAGQNAAQHPPNQPGPNHLGLQVPYANGGQQQPGTVAPATTNGARSSVPTQVQLMQIEQRIMQDAHNLGLEQQQLGTLRLMEAELARLRAQHQPAQTAVGASSTAASGQATFIHGPQFPAYAPPQQWHGNPTQQYGNGHEHLPPGMTLPEGWSVMPLQRTDALAGPQVSTQPASAEHGVPVPMQPPSVGINGAAPSAPTAPSVAPAREPSAPSETQNAGPTDDRGSPLFVPTQPAPSQASSAPAPSNDPPEPLPFVTGPSQPAPAPSTSDESGTKIPWNGDSSWSFVDQPDGHAGEGSSARQNGSAAGPAEGKGKGRAVEVEDAPDEG